MRIRQKLRLVILMAVALGIALTLIFVVVQREEERSARIEYALIDVSNRVFQLSLLVQDVYHHPGEPRPVEQWNKAHAQLAQMIDKVALEGEEERTVIRRLDAGRKRLAELFAQLRDVTAQPGTLSAELRERTYTQMSFIVQTMIADSLYLQRYVQAQSKAYRGTTNLIALLLAAVLTIGIARLAYLTGKRVTEPLLQLCRGTEIIGAGNLSHRVGTTAADEVGDLSRAFDAMLGKLQQVTASREELAHEVQRRRRAEEDLKKREESLKIAQAIAHLGHWEWDVHSDEVRWSDETYRILGYEPHSLTPSRETLLQVIHEEDRARVKDYLEQAANGQGFDIEFRIVLPDGRRRVVHGRGEPMAVGAERQPQVIGTLQEVAELARMEVLGVIQDITERKELESRLEREAHTDALTGAASRRYFMELAGHEFARVQRHGGPLAVLMLDLDHFKEVNDRCGHAAGDLVLKKLVEVCRSALREEDLIGRLGGEEFGIVLPETGDLMAVEVAQRLRAAVAEAEVPYGTDLTPIRFTTSIGVTNLRDGDVGIESMLNRADLALYAAKKAGRNRVCLG